MQHVLRLIAGGLSLFCLLVSTAAADVPHTINFQGLLKDSTGTPYTGTNPVKFSIYDSLGTEIWTSGFSSQTFSGGLVNVALGAPPQPPLPTSAFEGDTSLSLGITVDTDPEITPRIPLSTAAWAIHSGDADRVDGFEGSSFVQESGDTMSGSLTVMGDLRVGTDSAFAPVTISSGSNYSWDVGNGWGDLRIGDDTSGFSIGYAKDGPWAGSARLWSRGGQSEDIWIGNPSFGEVIHIKEIGDVNVLGRLGIGPDNLSPLSVQAEDKWTWGVGDGWGDVRIGDPTMGFNIGIALGGGGAGATRLWSKGGSVEDLILGSPTSGNQLLVKGIPDQINLLSDVSIGTETVLAPLTLQSQNQARWDIGSGLGDLRITNGAAGFSVGMDGAGNVNFWSSGGTEENLAFGSPTAGGILTLLGASGDSYFFGSSSWPGAASAVVVSGESGEVALFGGNDFYPKVELWGNTEAGQMKIYRDSHLTVRLSSQAVAGGGGELRLDRINPFNAEVAGARLSAGLSVGSLQLMDAAGILRAEIVALPAGGDAAVLLPDSSVSHDEILDEPGIAATINDLVLQLNSATPTDLATVEITIPSDGYITIEGQCYGVTNGTTGLNMGRVQIDESTSGPVNYPLYTQFGLSGHVNTGSNFFPVYVSRTYFKAAGTYTFHMIGMALSINGSGAVTQTFDHHLTARYYPTSYGAVSSVLASGENGHLESTTDQPTVRPESDGRETTRTVIYADLRELELRSKLARLRALKARQDALQAELELERAQVRQSEAFDLRARPLDPAERR